MNKSDIIKAAELAQKWLEEKPEARCFKPHANHEQYQRAQKWLSNAPHTQLQATSLVAAAELLKQVEVVEAGEAPQVGDLVTNIGRIANRVERIEGDKCFHCGGHYTLIKDAKIIQRNGLPVITKDKS